MIVTIVNIVVKPEYIEQFRAATLENHRHSVTEKGNLRFDVLQRRDDPAKFTLYEAYASDADVAAHKETAHYRAWRDAVADWMAEPRQGIVHNVVAPAERPAWKQ